MSLKKVFILAMGCAFLSGCASSAMKARKEQQAKVSQSAKLYCEFISGSLYHDVDVALNLEMAKRCDSDKPFTITQYKTQSEDNGILYCCSITGATAPRVGNKTEQKKATDKSADKKDDKKAEETIE